MDSSSSNPAPLVGQVTGLIGKVIVLKPDGSKKVLEEGSKVYLNDKILTESGSFAEIKTLNNQVMLVSEDQQLVVIDGMLSSKDDEPEEDEPEEDVLYEEIESALIHGKDPATEATPSSAGEKESSGEGSSSVQRVTLDIPIIEKLDHNSKKTDLDNSDHDSDKSLLSIYEDSFNSDKEDEQKSDESLPVAYKPVVISTEFSSENDNSLLRGQLDVTDQTPGEVLTFSLLSSPVAGYLILNDDGSFEFNPESDFKSLGEDESQTVTFVFEVEDTQNNKAQASIDITIKGTNDTPEVSDPVTLSTTQNDGIVTLNLLQHATDQDINDQLSITDLRLVSGTNSGISLINNALKIDTSVYQSLGENQSATITFAYKVADQHGAFTEQTATITINGTNDLPEIAAEINVATDEDASSLNVNLLAGVTDIDINDTINVVNLQTTAGNSAGVTTSADGNSLNIDPSNYEHLAQGESEVVRFRYDIQNSNGESVSQTALITVQGINDRSDLSVNDRLSYIENDAHVAIDNSLRLTDVDSPTIQSATIIISGNYKPAEDQLGFVDQNGISGNWDSASGTLSLTGQATVAEYQAALRGVTYSNGSESPDTAGRTISFKVNDGYHDSNVDTVTVSITAVNDALTAEDNTLTIAEDGSHSFTASEFGFSDVDTGDSLSNITITTLPTAGSLTLNGSAVTTNQIVTAADIPNLAFSPAANANGTNYANIGFSVSDGSLSSSSKTLTIDVTSVNDAPTASDNTLTLNEDGSHTFSVSEFGFSDVDVGDNLSSIRIKTLPAAGTLTLDGVAVTADQLIAAEDIDKLTFNPVANAHGNNYADIDFTVSDGELSSSAQTLTMNVAAVNDAPTTADNTLTINEDGSHTFSASDFGFSDIDTGDTLSSITIKTLPAAGSLTLNGSAVTANQVITAADIPNLVFAPAANANGTNYANIGFTVSDGSLSSSTQTLGFNVTAVNDAPTAADNTLTINEDGSHTFSASDFGFSDIDTGDTLASITITTLPGAGSLTLNGSAVTANQVITAADIPNLVFAPAANANGTNYANIGFTVSDGSLSSSTQTLGFNVTAVNDAPTAADNTLTINEDGSHTFSASDFGFSDIDAGDTLSSITITTLPGAGSLTLNGSAVTANQVITAADIPNLVFAPAANANGANYANIGFTVSDGSLSSSAKTLGFNVTALNDAPTAADSTLTINEDDTHTFNVSDFGFSDVDSGDTLSSITITTLPGAGSLTLNGSAVTANQVITAADIPNLVFAPAANANGANYANISFTVSDGSLSSAAKTLTMDVVAINDSPLLSADVDTGHASNGGVTITGATSVLTNDSDIEGDSLTVTDVNGTAVSGSTVIAGDFGDLTIGADGNWTYTPASIDLDSDLAGHWTFNEGSGTTAADSSESDTIADNGTLESGASFVADGVDGSAVTLGGGNERIALPDSTELNTYSGSKNEYTISLSFKVDPDNDLGDRQVLFEQGGRTNGFNLYVDNGQLYGGAWSEDTGWSGNWLSADISNSGSDWQQVTLVVNGDSGEMDLLLNGESVATGVAEPVGSHSGNMAFGGISQHTVFHDGDAIAESGFGFKGQIDEARIYNRALTTQEAKALDYEFETGTVQDVFTYTVSDGSDTSSTTLTIDVNRVPEGISGTLSATEDGGSIVGQLEAIDRDAGETLTFSVESQPAEGSVTVNADGSYSFNPGADFQNLGEGETRDVAFDYRVTDSQGDSSTATINVTVTGINDAPTAADNTLTINEDGSHTFSASDFGFSDIDSGDTLASITITTLPGAGSLTLNGSAVTANQVITAADIPNLVFAPAANANGANYASFGFTVNDGSLSSSAKTLGFNVTALNDAPTAADNTLTINEDGSHTFSASDFGFSDIDTGDTLSSITIKTLPAAGSLTLNGSAVTANQVITAADIPNLVFAPAANANGTNYANIGFTVSDGSLSSSTQTLGFNVTAVNDAPTAADNTLTINEDGSHTFSASDFGFSDIDTGDTLASITITTLPGAGSLTLNGSAVTANQVITAADIPNLVFAPAANANGTNYANIGFTVSDGSLSSSTQTLGFNVTAVNDAPTAADNTLTINEDGSHTFSASDFRFQRH